MDIDGETQSPVKEAEPLIEIPKCKHATERPSPNDYGSMVTIIAGTGDKTKSFQIHSGLLKHYSSYFRSALKPIWHNGDILLTEDDPKVVQLFFHWLYSGKLFMAPGTDGGVPITHKTLCSLYVFSDVRGIPELGNAAIDVFMQKWAHKVTFAISRLNYVYENTLAGSKLRAIFVELAVSCLDFTDLATNADTYPKEFLADVILRSQELNLCPGFGTDSEQKFIEDRFSDLCSYHDHGGPVHCMRGHRSN